jgi:F420-dependent oxidoreductase-like protein
MRLGVQAMRSTVNFGLWGSEPDKNVQVARLAESLGYDSIWTAEASGTDAVVPLTWLAANTETIKLGTAVMQMSARPPTTTAMTAATLDLISGGRFILGLGVSGPAVVEGWHGQPYGKPLAKTREYVKIVRSVLSRVPVDHDGDHYSIPYREAGGSPAADPVRLMFRPRRASIPIYLAAMGPRNMALAYEICDGAVPAFYNPTREHVFFDDLPKGMPRRDIEIAPFVPVAFGSDLAACRRRLKPGLAFWLGGMGSRGRNFYNDLIVRMGYEGEAHDIQRLYTSGRRSEAARAVPDQLVDEIALVGPRENIAEQLLAWKASSVTTMILNGADVDALTTLAELVL